MSLLSTLQRLETTQLMRRLILLLALIGIVATVAELLLIGHSKSPVQWIPFLMLALAALSFGWVIVSPNALSLRVLQIVMVIVALSSAIGVYEHFMGNLEFQHEIKPNLAGWPLIWRTLKGGVPLLAPGILFQVGLLGLLYSFRHPDLKTAMAVSSRIMPRDAS